MKLKFLFTILIAFSMSLSVSGAFAAKGGKGKGGNSNSVEICHVTGSASNPFLILSVSESAQSAHLAHGDSTTAGGDCFPDPATLDPEECLFWIGLGAPFKLYGNDLTGYYCGYKLTD